MTKAVVAQNDVDTAEAVSMSSLDFLNNIINPARVAAGEKGHEPRKFNLKIEDELLDELPVRKFIPHPYNPNQQVVYYDLNFDQMTLVGMRESKAVRRSVLRTLKEYKEAHSKAVPKTYSEALMAAALQAQENERLALENKQVTAEKERAQEEVRCMDKLLAGGAVYNSTQLAKLFGVSAQSFNKVMSERGMMYRAQKNKKYYPVQKFVDAGMFVSIPDKWGVVYMFTQAGMLSLVQAQGAIFGNCKGFKEVTDLDVLMLQTLNDESYTERKASERTDW